MLITLSDKIRSMIEEHSKKISPELSFLEDYVEYRKGGEINKIELYQNYCNYCTLIGETSKTEEQFGVFTTRHFPKAISSGPLWRNKKRNRYWQGLAYIQNPNDAEVSTHTTHANSEIEFKSSAHFEEVFCAD